MTQWLALMVGNSRWHWAEFSGETIQTIWHTNHGELPTKMITPLYFASVVPTQNPIIYQQIPTAIEIKLTDIPLQNLYPSFGIDRALALFGAGQKYGFPCLVIDGGTALTFSGADGDLRLIGGAILPGLKLQFQTLAQGTAALPNVTLPHTLPPYWATDTQTAIASGILHTILGGIKDFTQQWWKDFPTSKIILTGGDGAWLAQHLPGIDDDPYLIFDGFKNVVMRQDKYYTNS